MTPIHEKKPLRLPGYDSSQPGGYFVTLVTKDRELLFGTISQDLMIPNPMGDIVLETWAWLDQQYPSIVLNEYCLMPNHFHGIITIVDPANGSEIKSLGQIIGAFKTVSTRRINLLRGTPAQTLWQPNFHEHVVRGPDDLQRAQAYIAANPLRWLQDSEYPR